MRSEFPGVEPFVETLTTLDRHANPHLRNFFDHGPVTIARAPGRLDVMGGIADYSGSLVLQRPTAEATFVALQPSDSSRVEIASLKKNRGGEQLRTFSIELGALAPEAEPLDYESARMLLTQDAANHWASYVIGPLLVLMRERDVRLPKGVRILISSAVPEGKGVASSAALEVSVMKAVTESLHVSMDSRAIALLCQKAENAIAGAACGVMDQMTAVFGQADSLFALLCQPAELQPSVRVPAEIAFWGLDSGERHAVGGASYESVRTGAFMGHRIIGGAASVDYLANVDPFEFERQFAPVLPEEILGEEFLARYGRTSDSATRVIPSRVYKVRQPTAHPVYEHHRVIQFRELLLSKGGEERWTSMGELMYQSHASYSACGLGSSGTDRIVQFVREAGPAKGLYGARITGGGSGGTVAVLGRADADRTVRGIAERYSDATGHEPVIFSGASSGAESFGSLTVNL